MRSSKKMFFEITNAIYRTEPYKQIDLNINFFEKLINVDI